MRSLRHRLPHHATIVAYLALFGVLAGGVSYALKSNSVKSRHIVNGTIRGKDVKDGDLTGRDLKGGSIAAAQVRDRSLTGDEISPNSLRGSEIDESSLLGVVPYGSVIPSGVTLVGAWGGGEAIVKTNNGGDFLIPLPAPAPVPLTGDKVNFDATDTLATDPDPACDGTLNAPTAPPGKVCLYVGTNVGGGPEGWEGEAVGDGGLSDQLGFLVVLAGQADAPDVVEVHGTWAYTAP